MRHHGNMDRSGGKEREITRAQEHEPKRQTSDKPAHAAGVGNERKADVRGTQEGGSAAEARGSVMHSGGLGGAMKELHEQHPIAYHDHGPHHGHEHHVRHEPLHGMKPHHKG